MKEDRPFYGNRKLGQVQAYVQIIFFLIFLWKNNYLLPLELRKLFYQKINGMLSSTIALVLRCLNNQLLSHGHDTLLRLLTRQHSLLSLIVGKLVNTWAKSPMLKMWHKKKCHDIKEWTGIYGLQSAFKKSKLNINIYLI